MKIRIANTEHATRRRIGAFPDLVPFSTTEASPASALTQTMKALGEAKATYWLCYGTLLGFAREGGFLPHDDDIDLAVAADVDAAAVVRAMQAHGMRQIEETVTGSGVVNQKFLTDDGIMVDLFYVFDRGGEYLNDECRIVGHSHGLGTHPRRKLVLQHFAGFADPIPVPEGADTYLAHLYGDTWQQPVKFWDWVFSPPNAIITLRPMDVPLFVARWGIYILRRTRNFFRTTLQRTA